MYNFHRFFHKKNGNIAAAIMSIIGVTSLVTILSFILFNRSRMTMKKVKQSRFLIQSFSGLESMLLAYRSAEIAYIKGVNGCNSAMPFIQALKTGSGCATVPAITVFTGTDAGTTDNVYSLTATGCTISNNSSTCSAGKTELMNIGITDPAQKFDGNSFRFFLTSPVPEKQMAEFSVIITDSSGKTSTLAFAIRSSLSNAAHLDSSDGLVIQENPDPVAICPGTKWGAFLVFNPGTGKCQNFSQYGSGTGLAFYHDNYFGLRSFDGQIIMLNTDIVNAAASYMVAEDGTLGGAQVFPPYSKDALINVDDITTIADQIYMVSYVNGSPSITALQLDNSPQGYSKIQLCDLGALGYSQAYDGIAALAWSDPLLPVTGDLYTDRMATFFLKTSGGDLLTATVSGAALGAPYACNVFKDANLQQIENTRTLGFDRTNSTKPYILY